MGQDDQVGVDLGEAGNLDQLFLRHRDEHVMELDVAFQDFDVLDEPAVGDFQFAVQAVGAGIGLAVFRDLAEVHVADELGDVLVLGIAGLEGADAAARAFGQGDLLDLHLFPEHVALVVLELGVVEQAMAADGAKIAFDLHAGQDFLPLGAVMAGNQMQGILGHGAAIDGVERRVGRVFLEALLEQAGNGGLARGHRSHEHQDALAGFGAARSGVQELDDVVDGFVHAEDLFVEEIVADQILVAGSQDLFGGGAGALADDHVVKTAGSGHGDGRIRLHQFQVFKAGPLP